MAFHRSQEGKPPGISRAEVQAMVEEIREDARHMVVSSTPYDTGLMGETLSDGKHLRVFHRLDYIALTLSVTGTDYYRGAPADTIKAFMRQWKLHYPARHPRNGDSRPWYDAWKFLTSEQKYMLRYWREAGDVAMGGPYPPPSYLGAVDRGLVPGASNRHAGFLDEIAGRLDRLVRWKVEDWERAHRSYW